VHRSSPRNLLRAARVQPVTELHPRRERNAAESRQRILSAAETEFAKKGYDGARLGQIARTADVQQALIHHYFRDKEGLYRAVIEHAMGALSTEGWDVFHRLAQPLDRTRVAETVEAFVDLLLRQSVAHAPVLAILRHAAAVEDDDEPAAADLTRTGPRPEALVRNIMREKTKPVFDAVVALIEDMRDKGHIRSDVDAPQLCISALSMTMLTPQDEGIVRAVWNLDPRSPEFLRQRKKEVVTTLLARILKPPSSIHRV